MVSDDFLKKKKKRDSHTPHPINTYIKRVTSTMTQCVINQKIKVLNKPFYYFFWGVHKVNWFANELTKLGAN